MKALLEKIRKILRSRRTRQLLTRTVSGIAAIVVFVTTYALVLPAITMEQEARCGIMAHEHTDACYEERLVCQIPEDESHHHGTSCYEKVLICGQEVHVHSTECYQQDSSAVVSSGTTTAASTDLGVLVESDLYGRDGSEDSGDDAGSIMTHSGSNAIEVVEEESSANAEDSDLAADTNPGSEATNPEASGNGISENTDSVTTNPVDAESQSSEENKIAAPEENRDAAPEGDKAVASEEETVSGTEDVNDEKESLGLETADSPDLSDGSGSVSDASDRSAADTSDAGQEFNDPAAGTSDVKTENAETTDVESAKTAYTESAETAGTEAAAQEAANSATTNVLPEAAENENLSEGYVPELDSIEFGSVLNKHTDFYYFHPEEGQEIPASSAEITDWKKVKNDLFGSTKLESTDLVKLYLSYTIPAGALNETNQVARYRLPSNIHLTDEQIIAINSSENGMSAIYAEADPSDTGEAAKDENAVNYQKYLGVEAIEGTRTPDRIRKEDEQEYISAIVKAENVFDEEGMYGEKGAFLGQDLIFIFTHYSIEKNQTIYNADGNPLSAGEKITGWFACDFNMSQIDWGEEDTDLDNRTVEKTAEIVFVEKDSEKNLKEISRTLKLVDVTGDQSDVANGGETASTAETAAVAETASTDETASVADTASEAETATASATAGTDAVALENASVDETVAEVALENAENGPFKSGTLTANGNGYRITLDYTEKAKIPENAELSVREITAETDREAYEACLEQAGQQVASDEKTGVDQKASRFFDIEILVKDTEDNEDDGKGKTYKIEPSAPVSVNIQIIDDQASEGAVSADQKVNQGDPAVLHFAEEGVEQIDSTVKNSQEQVVSEGKDADKESEPAEPVTEISFEAESFSIYGVVYTVDFHWEVDGKTFDFSIPGGGFVSFEHLVEALGIQVSDTNTIDKGKNEVKIAENDANETFKNVGEEQAVLSAYDDAIKLNEAAVSEATKKFVADVESVDLSNPELVWIGKVNEDATVGGLKEANRLDVEYSYELTEEQVAEINAQTVEAGDWALISVQPFTTEETLTVTMKNGDHFKIQVTDAQIQTHYLSDSGKLYEVTVTYTEDAMIPEGAVLKVTEFEEDSEEYRKARNTVLADMIAREESIDLYTLGLAALDISILDYEGKEIEPSAPVRVDLRIKELPGVDNLGEIESSLMINHHIETEEGIVIEKVYDGGINARFLMETQEAVTAGSKAVDPESVDRLEKLSRHRESESDVDASFMTPVFSTFTVTWESDKKTTVHYGYMNGNTFVEFDEPVEVSLADNDTFFLIRDFEGYHYAFGEEQPGRTYYSDSKITNPTTGISIIPRLIKSTYYDYESWSWRTKCNYYLASTGTENEVSDNSHIYLVYEKDPDPVQGGTLVPRIVGDDTPPTIPSILKESVDNGNGTNTLSLSIRGATKEKEIANVADVIVIFDVSGSMRNNMAGEGKYLYNGSYYKHADTDWFGNIISFSDKIETADTRLQHAKDAVDKLANTLYGMNNSLAPQKIRMGLVSFSNTSKVEYTLSQNTDDYTASLSSFKNKVDSLTADGGTNWEAALQAANQMAVATDRDTYIIFVTDGDPTFRYTRMGATDSQLRENDIFNNGGTTYTYYNNISVFGKGDSDDRGNNYAAALAEAKNIVSSNKNLYAIAVSNDVKKMEKLIEDAEGKEAYLAADVDDLNDAFDKIADSIFATNGWGEIKMTDGITDLTNTIAKAGLMNVDGDFVYYRAPAPDNWAAMTAEERNAYQPEDNDFVIWTEEERKAAGCEDAIYERPSGSVQWNMGSGFMLEDGVTYKVSFICWPTQEAYDLLADLKNGIIQYKDLTPEQAAQIYENPENTGHYVVKTNKDGANTTYKPAVQTGTGVVVYGDEQRLPFQTVDPMILKGEKILVRKNWKDSVNTGHRAEKVKFHLLVDGKYYQKDGTFKSKAEGGDGDGAYVIEVSKDTTPTAWVNEVAIAPGVIRGNDVLEFGHSYALEEYEATGGDNYGFSFEFHSAVVRPMVIDSRLTYLIEDDSNKPDGAVEHSIAGRKYYSVVPESDSGTVYYEAAGNTGVIEGTNYKTSELDITKIVQKGSSNMTEADLNKETFTYRVTLEIPAGTDTSGITGYDYFEYTVGENEPFKLYGYQPGETAFPEDIARFGSEDDSKKIYRSWNTTNADIQENFLTTNQDGSKTIQMDVTISQLEVFRFTNLPTGTQYTIQEIYANQYLSAEPNVYRYNGGRAPIDKDGNLAEQGYSITKVQSTNGTKTTTEITNDTLTGVIDEANKRYYNQFTNTLGNVADANLYVTKHLGNYSWSGERYYFKLMAGRADYSDGDTPFSGTAPMPNRNTLYLTNDSGSEDETYSFGEVRYTRPGTYVYTITETDKDGRLLSGTVSDDGVIYGASEVITVLVETRGGKLAVTKISNSKGEVISENAEGTAVITGSTVITNSLNEVPLKKIDSVSRDVIQGAVFELYLNNREKQYLDDKSRVLTQSQVETIIGMGISEDGAEQKMKEAKISSSFTIGETVLRGLPLNKSYVLKETKAPDGYITTSNDFEFSLIRDSETGEVSISLKENQEHISMDNEEVTIVIDNTPGAALPNTGGPGTRMLYLLGTILTVFAAAGLVMPRCRRAA